MLAPPIGLEQATSGDVPRIFPFFVGINPACARNTVEIDEELGLNRETHVQLNKEEIRKDNALVMHNADTSALILQLFAVHFLISEAKIYPYRI